MGRNIAWLFVEHSLDDALGRLDQEVGLLLREEIGWGAHFARKLMEGEAPSRIDEPFDAEFRRYLAAFTKRPVTKADLSDPGKQAEVLGMLAALVARFKFLLPPGLGQEITDDLYITAAGGRPLWLGQSPKRRPSGGSPLSEMEARRAVVLRLAYIAARQGRSQEDVWHSGEEPGSPRLPSDYASYRSLSGWKPKVCPRAERRIASRIGARERSGRDLDDSDVLFRDRYCTKPLSALLRDAVRGSRTKNLRRARRRQH